MNYCKVLGRAGSQHQSAFLIRFNSFARFLFVILGLLGARVLPAAEQFSVDSAVTTADQLKALRDQTIIESSVWLDTEWDQFEHGAEKAKWTLENGGCGRFATSKTALCVLRFRSFMTGVIKSPATSR